MMSVTLHDVSVWQCLTFWQQSHTLFLLDYFYQANVDYPFAIFIVNNVHSDSYGDRYFTERFKNKSTSGNTQIQRKNSEHLTVLHHTATGMVDGDCNCFCITTKVQHSVCSVTYKFIAKNPEFLLEQFKPGLPEMMACIYFKGILISSKICKCIRSK